MKKYLLIDISNVLYRNFFAHKSSGLEISLGMSLHSALVSLNYYYRKYRPSDIVCVFDSSNWRKVYTSSGECLTHKPYKGNRRKNLTKKEAEEYALLDKAILDFYDFLKNNSSIITLKSPLLEADDIIAGFVDYVVSDRTILLSSDHDYIQLLDNEYLTIVDPIKDEELTLSEWDNSVEYFLFEKMIRGDVGDNVMSAYPRLSSKKIKEAMSSKILLNNIMNHEFVVENLNDAGELVKHTYITKDVYEENEMLMNLRKQPQFIRKKIVETILNYKKGKFNYFSFIKMCGAYRLDKILESTNNYSECLSLDGGSLELKGIAVV
jgi:hypothetical protein